MGSLVVLVTGAWLLVLVSPAGAAHLPAQGADTDLRVPAPAALSLLSLQDSSGAVLYKRHCEACHGEKGEGDGRAAVAFNPPPANLTDRERMERLSDEELRKVISQGRRAMPRFEQLLSPEELTAVVAYVRSLRAEGGK